MKGQVSLEGSDDDAAELLVRHQVLTERQAKEALAELRATASSGAAATFQEVLLAKGALSSPLKFQVVRVTTKAVAQCAKCATPHQIYFYLPGSAHACAYCRIPLPAPVREGQPPDPASTLLPPVGGGETMLDLGTAASPAKGGAPASDLSATLLPTAGGGETMLDLSRPDRPAPPPPDPSATLAPAPGGGETMLDLGAAARSGSDPTKKGEGITSSTFRGTIVLGGSGTSAPTVRVPPSKPAPPPSATKATSVPGRSSSLDPRLQGTPPTRRGTVSSIPRSTTGGAAGSSKGMPAEVVEASKDPNRLFGKYVLVRELGRGGAGVVYKAWDSLLSQHVALKFIRDQGEIESDTSTGTQRIEEFQREARMSVKLRHPNIVRIYELGCMSNRYYLSMEYIEGGTLLEVIRGSKEKKAGTTFASNPEKFLRILQKVSEGVDYAHKLDPPVVHRDLKPHNVLVDRSGSPYVVDFGLAKEVEFSETGMTLTGVVKGTPSYMAPEQAEGRNREVDARTDIYSLGAILYEIVTGRPPFVGESVPELLRKIATELPERPNDVIMRGAPAKGETITRPVPVPKPLETICLKALEKNPADRYPSAKDFADDIDRYLRNEDILAQEPSLWRRFRRSVRKRPVLAGSIAAVLVTALAFTIAGRYLRPAPGAEAGQLLESIVERGSRALDEKDWVGLKSALDDLRHQAPKDPRAGKFETALREHEQLVGRTRAEWAADLERVRREPLKGVLPSLREKILRCPEIKPELRELLRTELVTLQSRLVAESRRLVGSGARPAWVEEIIKQGARETQDQVQTLAGLAADPEFSYPADPALEEARQGLSRVVAYQGTWTLQVNVAPFAEVIIRRSDKEVATDFTPLGLQDLEVVGSSYTVELCWPSRAEPKLRLAEEIRDLRHGQTVVIRGDLSKSSLKQERK